MRILLTGASGYLGQHVLYSLSNDPRNHITASFGDLESFPADWKNAVERLKYGKYHENVELVDRLSLDISNFESVQSFFSTRQNDEFDAVIHLTAISSPFQCEKNPQKAVAMNHPTHFLDKLLSQTSELSYNDVTKKVRHGKPLIFIFLSTDQVYDGFHAPYEESNEAKPVNLYGKTKLDFEKTLISLSSSLANRKGHKRLLEPIILRSSLILGSHTPIGTCRKQTFLQFTHEMLANKCQDVEFFNNEFRNVVFVNDVVRVIAYFLNNSKIPDGLSPIFNMGGKDKVSRVEIAYAVAEHLQLDKTFVKSVEKGAMTPLSYVPKNEDEIILRSPPDISMKIDKLENISGLRMTGLKSIVNVSF